ncbi:hypothetical protein AALO_G00066880 [Alosa alosa]|uniref:Uncharacterized protein n=1 Tax=Alosa alosa TaxID=278164 RepID=A0AAV6H345_9TELE|nr:hypothetical protein AALO_G00066880 [Alosa alosa]
MPISSGASGKIGADSYLKIYLETLPKTRRKDILDTLVGHQNQSCLSGPDGDNMNTLSKALTEETALHHRGSKEEVEVGRKSGKEGSKKSPMCAIL